MLRSDLPVCLPESKLARTATGHKHKAESALSRYLISARGSRLLPRPLSSSTRINSSTDYEGQVIDDTPLPQTWNRIERSVVGNL